MRVEDNTVVFGHSVRLHLELNVREDGFELFLRAEWAPCQARPSPEEEHSKGRNDDDRKRHEQQECRADGENEETNGDGTDCKDHSANVGERVGGAGESACACHNDYIGFQS